jgi:DNA-directed RNA polymerase alpha subunit
LSKRARPKCCERQTSGLSRLNEIKDILAQLGLNLGMEIPAWPPENIKALAEAYAASIEE